MVEKAEPTHRETCRGLLTVIAMGLALGGPPARGDTYPRQPGVDVQHYAFRLTLRDDSDEIEGEATIDLLFARDGVDEFALDLASSRGGRGMTVEGVRTQPDAAVEYAHADDRIKIKVGTAKAGDRRIYKIKYKGMPASGLRIGPNKYQERTFFSDSWPDKARQWLPTIDHPYDKATGEFFVTAPAKYQVVSNGLLVEEVDLGDGRRMTHWKGSIPIATWLHALGVAQFASRHAGTVRGTPLEIWSYHQDADKGRIAFEGPARRVLEFYGEKIGPFRYEKLGNVEAKIEGAMELASAIFYGELSLDGKPATDLVAHEVMHQWFGDSVTERDWDDVWLSEGFATYGALLFAEHDLGRDAFVAGLKRSRDVVLDVEKKEPGLAVIHDRLADMDKVLNRLVYEKGAWTLHMLRAKVGDDAFWAGLRAYYRRYRDANASTDDFRRVMDEASGKDLAPFFRQWLRRAGSPVVEGTWSYEQEKRRVVLDLEQVQPGEPFALTIEVGTTPVGPTRTRVEMIGKRQRVEIPADAEPTAVVLDPDTWVLMNSRIRKR